MDKFDDFDEIDEIGVFEDMDEDGELLDFFDDDDIVIIEDEYGKEAEFYIIDSVKHKGHLYLLVAPNEEEGDEKELDASILKQTDEADGSVIYTLIEDDNEFKEVAALFMENEGDYEIDL